MSAKWVAWLVLVVSAIHVGAAVMRAAGGKRKNSKELSQLEETQAEALNDLELFIYLFMPQGVIEPLCLIVLQREF